MSFWGRGSARVTTSIRGFSHWGLSSYDYYVNKKRNTMTLGYYPQMSLQMAREEAKKANQVQCRARGKMRNCARCVGI